MNEIDNLLAGPIERRKTQNNKTEMKKEKLPDTVQLETERIIETAKQIQCKNED